MPEGSAVLLTALLHRRRVTGGGTTMSELSMDGVASTVRELEAGVADAEAELARTEVFGR